MKNKYLLPDHVRGLLERAIVLPMPVGWVGIIATALTTGVVPKRAELRAPVYFGGPNDNYVATRVFVLFSSVSRYYDPWRTTTVTRNIEHLASTILRAEKYERLCSPNQNP